MCRLFAHHAASPRSPHEELCASGDALRVQSKRHPHGWGIGWYDAAGLHVRRSVLAAHADSGFEPAVRAATSPVVVAHVRDASVGAVAPENTHPFSHGRWLLAHNGTVARFARHPELRARLEAELLPALRPLLAGATDSERCLFLFLTRLQAHASAGGQAEMEAVRRALHGTVATVVGLADLPAEKPSSLNLVVTNGELLAACRHGRSLHLALVGGVFELASEPIGGAPWREVPEDGFVGIDLSRDVWTGPLDGRARHAA